jgi:thiazoline dehydrogenase / protease
MAPTPTQSNFARLWQPSQVEAADAGEVSQLRSGSTGAPAADRLPGTHTTRSVPPLAKMTALHGSARLQEPKPDLLSTSFSLSRFAYVRSLDGRPVLESPLSQFRITLTDPRAASLLLEFIEPRSGKAPGERAGLPAHLTAAFAQLLWAGGFLAIAPEPPELRMWDFYNLVFHGRKRWHDSASLSDQSRISKRESFPVVKLPMSANIHVLPPPRLEAASRADQTLTVVMEARSSIRDFDDENPITLEQLGELLYRVGRVKSLFNSKDKFDHLSTSEPVDQEATLSSRPYPGAGARYELEIYPVVRHCKGLDSGMYHYDPLKHWLEKIKDGQDSNVATLIDDASSKTSRKGKAQVLFVVAARFGRMFEAYPAIGYSLILNDVGVLYQGLYLMATAMGLAPCALGEGDAESFGRATGLEFLEESVVGGFVVGTPRKEVTDTAANSAPYVAAPGGSERRSIGGSDANMGAGQSTLSRHSHDLDGRLPGLRRLRDLTPGDPRVTIVVLDGDPDLSLSCFRGGHFSKKYPFWHERAKPIAVHEHALYRRISDSGLSDEELQKRLVAAFPPSVLFRIIGDRHSTHITSTIAGRTGSPAPGLAPDCRVIVVPLNEAGDPGEFMSPLNLARAFDLARELGAHVIHCAACVPTQTDEPHELLARAVKSCLEHNILIVAPAGNDSGECRCIPGVIPQTLAVGALRDDGRPFKFNNWGGNYSVDGLMAPGEGILGAQPCTEQPIRQKGTSMAAPVVTGVAALLMSRQMQIGQPINAEAVREALLTTARPCDPAVVDHPERCLRGVIDLSAAMESLFGSGGGVGALRNLPLLFGSDMVALQSGISRKSSDNTAPDMSRQAIAPSASGVVAQAAAHGPVVDPLGESVLVVTRDGAVKQSTAHSGLVFALGRLSFDLGSEIGRQTLEQRMAQGVRAGELPGANPEEPRDLIAYLRRYPDERKCIIWTLDIDGVPVYALQPKGPYAEAIYEVLLEILAAEILPQDVADFVEVVSIPARREGRVVELLSRTKIPVVALTDLRGIYGWQINALVNEVVASTPRNGGGPDDDTLRGALADFLRKVYFKLHNQGLTSRDRAMNFAATNCLQAASAFAKALAERRVLETIIVEKSPVCRMHSDCWEVYLTFYDPEDEKRARRLCHFTVDVSDMMPVTVGGIKSWTQRRATIEKNSWLGRQDSNLGMAESKSAALPLGYAPTAPGACPIA